jgi:hypothetical protein
VVTILDFRMLPNEPSGSNDVRTTRAFDRTLEGQKLALCFVSRLS